MSTDTLPKHIAIIMDGNGRWATKRRKPRFYGHRAGHIAVRRTVEYAAEIGIEELTLFAFSSENYARPEAEVKSLMSLFSHAIRMNRKLFHKHNIQFRLAGDISGFSNGLAKEIATLQRETAEHSGLQLNIAANYGGKWDIVQAAKKLTAEVIAGDKAIDDITESAFDTAFSVPSVRPVDLLIRTAGEQRISNFLLWQCAYAEFYFDDVLWPDYDRTHFANALAEFAHRNRRFGKVPDDEGIE